MNRAAMRFLGATFGALVLITPAPSQIPNLKTGATVPTLAPLVRELTLTVVSICVHGRTFARTIRSTAIDLPGIFRRPQAA